MNHQSDYGYTIGELEHRTRELCESRARQCDALSRRFPTDAEADKYRQWAAEWRLIALGKKRAT